MYRGSMRLALEGAGKVEESDVKGFEAKVRRGHAVVMYRRC